MMYWERWIGDWKKKTAHLSGEEKGLYGELLDYQYATEKPLPDSIDQCCRIAGASTESERKAVAKLLNEFFPIGDGGRMNRRVAEEILKRQEFVQTKSQAAHTRWNKERKGKKKSNGATPPDEFIIPDWLDSQLFFSWISSRPSRARTPQARRAAVEKLAKFRERGHDANEIVRESLANGWQGIFEPKAAKDRTQSGLEERNRQAAERWLKGSQ